RGHNSPQRNSVTGSQTESAGYRATDRRWRVQTETRLSLQCLPLPESLPCNRKATVFRQRGKKIVNGRAPSAHRLSKNLGDASASPGLLFAHTSLSASFSSLPFSWL